MREVRRAFGPALLTRGVAQIGGYVDAMIASLLPTGAVAGLLNAQLLYTLPVSLFGMSVAAAELPAMASEVEGSTTATAALRGRLGTAMERIAFFVVPSAAAFLGLGHQVAALVFQSGRFTAADARFVWAILAGASVGLLAATLARLLGSAFYALGDTRTPFRFAVLRLLQGAAAGLVLALWGPEWVGVDSRWGVVGLTVASALAGWGEFLLLRRALVARLGAFGLPQGRLVRLWGAAGIAIAAGWGVALAADPWSAPLRAGLVIVAFGVVYLSLVARFGVPQAGELIRWVGSRRRASG
jgi:putative peptidoglycan lipid II flippase